MGGRVYGVLYDFHGVSTWEFSRQLILLWTLQCSTVFVRVAQGRYGRVSSTRCFRASGFDLRFEARNLEL